MVPLIELRGAIPVSQALKLPVISSYVVSIIGNMIPVPFIFLFARKFLEWGQDNVLWAESAVSFYCEELLPVKKCRQRLDADFTLRFFFL